MTFHVEYGQVRTYGQYPCTQSQEHTIENSYPNTIVRVKTHAGSCLYATATSPISQSELAIEKNAPKSLSSQRLRASTVLRAFPPPSP